MKWRGWGRGEKRGELKVSPWAFACFPSRCAEQNRRKENICINLLFRGARQQKSELIGHHSRKKGEREENARPIHAARDEWGEPSLLSLSVISRQKWRKRMNLLSQHPSSNKCMLVGQKRKERYNEEDLRKVMHVLWNIDSAARIDRVRRLRLMFH